MAKRRNFYLCLAACSTLAAGWLVYLLDRPAADVYLLPDWFANLQTATGGLHDSLPSMLHAFAFSLLTIVGIAPLHVAVKAGVCAGWWLLETVLEIMQHAAIGPAIALHSAAWVAGIPVLENLPEYALNGTFDWWDIAFAGGGCAAAFLATLDLSLGRSANR